MAGVHGGVYAVVSSRALGRGDEERGGVNPAPFMGGVTPAPFVAGLHGNQRVSGTVPYLPDVSPLLSGDILGLSL